MYTIIPLLLAHIQELNKQILFLFNFIVKNIPIKSKRYDCYSPKYNKLKVDKLPILNTPVKKKNFKILLDEYFNVINDIKENKYYDLNMFKDNGDVFEEIYLKLH